MSARSMSTTPGPASHAPRGVFVFYRGSDARRAALARDDPHDPERYLFYGLWSWRAAGLDVRHSLEHVARPQAWAGVGHWINHLVHRAGGCGGEFANVLRHRRRANASDRVLCTVDTVGLPVAMLARLGLIRPPVIYVSIGLPERIARMTPAMAARYRRLIARMHRIVAYGWGEAEWLRAWLDQEGRADRVHFVAFGVDVDRFRPATCERHGVDVLSFGADPQRDFATLVAAAAQCPSLRVRIHAPPERTADLPGPLPANVELAGTVPLAELEQAMTAARLVVLPVHDNSYSGATTSLLQAMAMGKAVVVTRTRAIAQGYGLEHDRNVAWTPPGDARALAQTMQTLCGNADRRAALGAAARDTVVSQHAWPHYVERMMRACDLVPQEERAA